MVLKKDFLFYSCFLQPRSNVIQSKSYDRTILFCKSAATRRRLLNSILLSYRFQVLLLLEVIEAEGLGGLKWASWTCKFNGKFQNFSTAKPWVLNKSIQKVAELVEAEGSLKEKQKKVFMHKNCECLFQDDYCLNPSKKYSDKNLLGFLKSFDDSFFKFKYK